jgi:hypothetical protein
MPEKEALAYLETELRQQIAGFDESRKFYRSAQFNLTMATTVLSAVATILIAAGHYVHADWWFILPLVFSASITVAASYESFLRPKELWLQKTDTWMALQNLDAHIKYAKAKSANTLSQDEVDKFYGRFDDILMNEHSLWMTLRSARDQAPRSERGLSPPAATAPKV